MDRNIVGVAATWGAAGALAVLCGLHLYWAAGGFWPGHDEESLARKVVGGPPGMRAPVPAACVVVAALLGLAAALLLGQGGAVRLPGPPALIRVGAWGVVAVLTLRGLYGFVDRRMRPQIVGSPYERLNVRLYSPLCLALGLTAAVAMLCSGR